MLKLENKLPTRKIPFVSFYTECIVRSMTYIFCIHGMERHRVADGRDGLQMWRVAVNILHKQSLAADKGWSPGLGWD